jgi:hypothetical protein
MTVLTINNSAYPIKWELKPQTPPFSFWQRLADLIQTIRAWFSATPQPVQAHVAHAGDNKKHFHQLNTHQCLSTAVFQKYIGPLPQGNVIIDMQYIGGLSPVILDDTKNVVVPVILKGWFRDHIICVTIDHSSGLPSMFIYDPKGRPQRNWDVQIACQDKTTTLRDVLEQLARTYIVRTEAPIRVQENDDRHQNDSYNCGVYVADYIKDLSEGTDPSPRNPTETRQAMITALGLDKAPTPVVEREEAIDEVMVIG